MEESKYTYKSMAKSHEIAQPVKSKTRVIYVDKIITNKNNETCVIKVQKTIIVKDRLQKGSQLFIWGKTILQLQRLY